MKRTKAQVSEVMRRVRSLKTGPEVALQKALRRAGASFKSHVATLPGKPDIVFAKRRLAVFVDGDFWHGNQWAKRGFASLEQQFGGSPSRKYWIGKIRHNMDRDCRASANLVSSGWKVLRFWETDLQRDVDRCTRMTLTLLKKAKTVPYSILPSKTVAEFFAGIGLMRLGLEGEGWDVKFANDNDPLKREMYDAHFGSDRSHFVLNDIQKLKPIDIPSVALATASFPCNDLSLAGARRGLDGVHSSTFWHFIWLLQNMKDRKPPLVLVENVPGFLSSHGGRDFQSALEALNSVGYSVDAFMLDAACFVPQSRQRLFVVGVLQSNWNPPPPAPLLADMEGDVRPRALSAFIRNHPRIAWNLRSLPPTPARRLGLEKIVEDLPEKASEWWNAERTAYLLNQMSARHRRVAEALISLPRHSFGTVFRRVRNEKSMAELRTDGLAGCLRTPRGGSGRQILIKAGKGTFAARLLTPRECARLMGADAYHIDVPLNQALFGFGDAVCVPAINWIAKYYLNPVVSEMTRGIPLGSAAKARTA